MLNPLFKSLAVLSATLATGRALGIPSNLVEARALRIVPVINCTPLSGAAGKLVMTNSATLGDASLPEDGVPLGLVNKTLEEVGNDSHQTFVFSSCSSTFMNETATNDTFYGHISPSDDATSCLVAQTGMPDPQPVVTEPCSLSDDSGQMLQFWKIVLDKNQTKPALVSFVGLSARSTSTAHYETGFDVVNGTNVVHINYVKSTNVSSTYQIKLVPTA
ncbi:SubName: Full=Uncharacterized protein {ECO:0000313/EMBL:CCA71519.1} [Serendipita indica DSM 11827]|nr:SubName: Full=Uncharacterized protein {ECO:0000313/EMBL:CCA71519.1} [Serendipita indica DSM 11827]